MSERDPNGVQRLLWGAVWDEDAEAGVFVGDETGFLKKGTKSVGAKRQYSGTAGKRPLGTRNCQVGVFLGYGSARGHASLDRRLYLPQEWTADQRRRAEAGVPEDARFATKPQLLQAMLAHAWERGIRGG